MAFPWELGIGKEEAVLLKDLLLSLRGDPRLTQWEEQFVVSLQRSVDEHGHKTRLSDKQVAVLKKLQDKTDAPEQEGQDLEEADPDGSDL